jgi:hypothetical protein
MGTNDSPQLKAYIAAPSIKLQTRDIASFTAGLNGEAAEEIPAAVIVFHGIGEEVKFGTLSSAASLLLTEARERGAEIGEVVIRSVAKDNPPKDLAVRAELEWTEKADPAHDKPATKRQVHVYEVYWAPLTMGKVTYWETMGFLLSAGWNGLLGTMNAVRGRFNRWLFGDFRELKIGVGTVWLLLVLMFMLGIILGAIAMAVAAAAGVAQKIGEHGDVATKAYDALNFVYAQIATPWNWLAGYLHWAQFAPVPSWDHKWQVVLALALWGVGVGLAYWFQQILTVYAGSLVAYLSPYKDSKWEDLRSAIQQRGLDIAKVVYDGHNLPSGQIPKYDRIVILGHSLGSVIAYDTLNAMINISSASVPDGIENSVVRRTRGLITFGSPLDKTAFLFRLQFKARRMRHDTEDELREMMVSAVQPLIADYNLYRHNPGPPRQRPKWINIWSRFDIVSGKLDYYDDPAVEETDLRHVQNKIDPQSCFPIYAHLQYWSKKMLRETAYDELFS